MERFTKKKLFILLSIVVMFAFISCNNNVRVPPEIPSGIQGTWSNETGDDTLVITANSITENGIDFIDGILKIWEAALGAPATITSTSQRAISNYEYTYTINFTSAGNPYTINYELSVNGDILTVRSGNAIAEFKRVVL